jgi:hypothetical protein
MGKEKKKYPSMYLKMNAPGLQQIHYKNKKLKKYI